jgi:hypothetical protein
MRCDEGLGSSGGQSCHKLLVWVIPQLDKFPRVRRYTLAEWLEAFVREAHAQAEGERRSRPLRTHIATGSTEVQPGALLSSFNRSPLTYGITENFSTAGKSPLSNASEMDFSKAFSAATAITMRSVDLS